MKRHASFLSLLLCLSILAGAAQEMPLPESLSLEQAIEIARRNSTEIEIRSYDYAVAEERVAEARFRLLPVASGNVDFQRNLIIPTTPVPANAFNPGAPANEINALRFGTNWTAGAGLNLAYPLLDKSIPAHIRAQEEEVKLAAIEREISEAELTTEVSLAYTECLLAQAQIEWTVNDTLNSRINLNAIDDQYRNGRATVAERNQAMIELNNAKSRLADSYRVLAQAQNKLFYYLGARENATMTFDEDLEDLYDKFRPATDSALDFDQTLTARQLQQQLNLTEALRSGAGMDALPTLTLRGFLGASFFDNNLRLFSADQWFGNSFIALSLDIPITSRFENKKRVAQLEYQTLRDRASLRAGKNQKIYEFQQALNDLTFYQAELDLKEQNRQLSEDNYQAALQRYQEGRSTANALSSADFLFKQAKSVYLQAYYNYIRAAITLEKIRRS